LASEGVGRAASENGGPQDYRQAVGNTDTSGCGVNKLAATVDGTLKQEAFAPLFGDFEDMYLDSNRFVSIGAIMSSPVVDRGIVYVGSMDGKLYAIQ